MRVVLQEGRCERQSVKATGGCEGADLPKCQLSIPDQTLYNPFYPAFAVVSGVFRHLPVGSAVAFGAASYQLKPAASATVKHHL